MYLGMFVTGTLPSFRLPRAWYDIFNEAKIILNCEFMIENV